MTDRIREFLRDRRPEGPCLVVDLDVVRDNYFAFAKAMPDSRVFYAVKANAHPGVLRVFEEEGLGFECVSAAELDHVCAVLPELDPSRLLFTPNFAPREEYVHGFEVGARVTLDNLHPLVHWPEVFQGREVFLRLDPGRGRGHHSHVRTAGAQSKFGLAPEQLAEIQPLLMSMRLRPDLQLIVISHHPEIINLQAREHGLIFERQHLGPTRVRLFAADADSSLTPAEIVARGEE